MQIYETSIIEKNLGDCEDLEDFYPDDCPVSTKLAIPVAT